MSAILILPAVPVPTDLAPVPDLPTATGADWGLALLAGPVPAQPAPQTAGPAPVATGDPLARWLAEQSGMSADFDAAPDAAMTALTDGLPPLPEAAEAPDTPQAAAEADLTAPMPGAPEPGATAQPAPQIPSAPPQPASQAPIAPQTDQRPAQNTVATHRTARPTGALGPLIAPRIGADASPDRDAAAMSHDPDLPPGPQVDRRASAPALALPPDTVPRLVRAEAADGPAPAATRDAPPVARPEGVPTDLNGDAALAVLLPDTQAPAPAPRLNAVVGPAWQPSQADPRPVIQQVADALIITREDRTEIALSPEELGRVRLILSGPDRAQITIWAERPETLELLRRNADLLNQQLADAGVASGSLDFRRDDRQGWPGHIATGPRDDDPTPMAGVTRIPLTPASLSDRRLDIRL